jgi:hypothetical protein
MGKCLSLVEPKLGPFGDKWLLSMIPVASGDYWEYWCFHILCLFFQVSDGALRLTSVAHRGH